MQLALREWVCSECNLEQVFVDQGDAHGAPPNTHLCPTQAEGKKRMKALGKVEVPQEAFMAVLNLVSCCGTPRSISAS